jgi:cellulose synthase/poly-beta-1,6-N-acetylglucosamine synthase-like glycosyltransferase
MGSFCISTGKLQEDCRPADAAENRAALALAQAFARNSPRLSPHRGTLRSLLIHGSVIALWLLLFAQVFLQTGVGFWSTGIAYTLYDTLLLVFVGWQALPLLQRRPVGNAQKPAAAKMRFAALVAAYNEARILPATLQALLTQQHAPDMIVIADDGSSDDTALLLTQQFGLQQPALGELSLASTQHANLYWLRLPHQGKARTLNAALLKINADVVLTVDADTLLAPDATAAMRDAFATTPGLVAAGGILTPVTGKSVGNRLFQGFQNYEYMRNFISRFAWMRLHSLLLISGAFACFRRDALLTVGGFDPDCLVEDYELVHRLQRHARDKKLDWQVQVIGSAHARTDAPGTTADFLKQRRRWFAGFLQTQYWNRDMTGNPRYGWLGTAMLPVKAIDTLQPVYGITAFLLLLQLCLTHRLGILIPVLGIIAAKTLLDLLFHLWSIRLYRRWTGLSTTTHAGHAVLAALAEPFSFQLLRHGGALLGWFQFLTRRQSWGVQRRSSPGPS